MKEAGITIKEEYVVPGYFTEEGTYQAVLKLLKLENPPTALITTNNLSTMGAYKALVDQNRKIPDYISIIGMDDFPMSAHLNPPITIVKRATTEVGRIAGEMLLERIDIDKGKMNIQPRTTVLRLSYAYEIHAENQGTNSSFATNNF